MKRTGPPSRHAPLTRHTPLRPANPKRRKQRQKAAYGAEYADWIRSLPCTLSGTGECQGRTEAAHSKSRGAGGDATSLVPLCALHHRTTHTVGRVSVRVLTGIDMEGEAARLRREWEGAEW